jgi:hydroxypyruvate isomerase
MGIKQSVCLPAYKTDLERGELFKTIQTMGFAAVEIWARDEDFDQICDLANANGLVLCSMMGHGSIPEGLNNPDNHNRIEDELRESIDIAAARRVPGLICFSGNRREGLPPDESIDICAEGLARITPYAEEKGINLNVELLNSKIDHPGYECDNTAWGLELVKKSGSPRVKLLYDIYHMQIMEGDLIRTIGEAIGSIGHFHTAGNPGRYEMDDSQELNYRGICGAISNTDYTGFVGHEFFPKGDILAGLEQAFAICDV